jgi:hypothetical protein
MGPGTPITAEVVPVAEHAVSTTADDLADDSARGFDAFRIHESSV